MKKVIVKLSTERKEREVRTKKSLQNLIDTRNIQYVCIDNVITFNMDKAMAHLK